MDYKNNRFNFFGEQWYIKYVDHCPLTPEQDEGAFNGGIIVPLERCVYISTRWLDGKPIPDESVRHSLLHELVHLMFLNGQYIEEYNDEPMVEWIAKSIMKLIDQNII